MSKRKAPSNDNNPNHDFTTFLFELANYEKNVNKNVYKFNAYRKAASVLAGHPTRIQSGEEAKKLAGVGDKISKKIDEFIQTGKLKKIETIREDSDSMAITELTRVSGIGPTKARDLVTLGIKSLNDLTNHTDKLTHHQKIGLKYFEDFEKKIPREEIANIESCIEKQISDFDDAYKITVCGSYRRGLPESGDIDIMLTHKDFTSSTKNKAVGGTLLKALVTHLEKAGLITETMSLGDSKFMGVCRLPAPSYSRRLDIRITPCDQFACCVLYFTGSDLFNKRMRGVALEQGFTLNEYSLRPLGSTGIPGEPVPIHSEEEIFDYINFPYTEPENRNK